MKISPRAWVRFHLVATAAWAVLAVPTVIWWHSSILWVALLSVYANFVSHFGAYQASRAEKAGEANNPDR